MNSAQAAADALQRKLELLETDLACSGKKASPRSLHEKEAGAVKRRLMMTRSSTQRRTFE